MLSKQPIGDMWSLPDNDPHSQHYGESLDFDFSYIHSEEMKSVVKDYIWHCCRVNNGALSSRQWLNRSLQYFMVFAKSNNIYSFKELKQIKITHKLNIPEVLAALRENGKFYVRFLDRTGPTTSGCSVLCFCAAGIIVFS